VLALGMLPCSCSTSTAVVLPGLETWKDTGKTCCVIKNSIKHHQTMVTCGGSYHLAPTGPTTSTTCSAYHTLRLTRLASKFVFIHPRLPSDRPFPLHGQVSPLVFPQSSPAEDTQIAQVPTPQVRAGSRSPSPHVAHDPSQFGPRSGPYLY